MRFANNCRAAVNPRKKGELKPVEIEDALLKLIKAIQMSSFCNEYACMQKLLSCPNNSNILPLAPFLDAAGVMRVGGRLERSNYPYNKKHPILLPKNNIVTKLLFVAEHNRNMHCGPNALLASIRNNHWPISGRNNAKETVRKCMSCFRNNAKSLQPIMANLPAHRVNPSPSFHNSGVDYAGPFKLKDMKGIGCKNGKAYVCLFICFATKAVHLEVVSELSSEAFIAALRRFSSRPSNLYSDNGINFVGANK